LGTKPTDDRPWAWENTVRAQDGPAGTRVVAGRPTRPRTGSGTAGTGAGRPSRRAVFAPRLRAMSALMLPVVIGVLVLAAVAALMCVWLVNAYVAPVVGLACLSGPFVWLWWKRKKRLDTFAAQLPEAMELVARALRAGHSLAAGMHVVAEEMPAPISKEFGRV